MPKCPQCGIERTDISTPCSVCGHKPAQEQPSLQSSPSPQRPARSEEKTLWEGHPSGLYYIGHWIVAIVCIFTLVTIPVSLILILYAVLDQKTKVFTLTTRKVMMQSGIISRKTSEVGTRDILSINMSQGILERLFGLGTVQIGSAGTGGIEVEFKGIKNPAKVRDHVRKTKDHLEA